MNSEKIKDASLDKLRQTIKDCDETMAFVKKRTWAVGMSMTPEMYQANTDMAIATCIELKRNCRSQIRKRLAIERQKKDRG